ncbi:MAG: zinc dependent phospholipase C family protein [Pseudomonadota bacterium]
MKWFLAVGIGLLLIAVSGPVWAWGPATHLQYGLTVLGQLSELAASLRSLLTDQAVPFLYGCVSADIVLAKKLGRAMTHCHSWENGVQLIDGAQKPRLRSFALGYVSHLAADTISHNCYVPSKTIESYDSGILKHLYWELIFDRRVSSSKTSGLLKEIANGDFADCDDYVDTKIPTRVFDFSTNKRIFNHLLMIQGFKNWQKLWAGLSKRNPWPLEDREVKLFSERSVGAMMSVLKEFKESKFVDVDPMGRDRLKGAKQLRRHYKRELSRDRPPSQAMVRNAADRFAREPFRSIQIDDLKAA